MNRVGIFLAVAACGAFEACAVAFPAAAGGTVTVDVPAGETVTYDQALPSATTGLVKTGGGVAVLSAASGAGTCPVEVREGTLKVQEKTAMGSAGDVVVKDGATLHFNFAGAAQGTISFSRPVHLAGAGVDGAGAFRHTHPVASSTSEDSLLAQLHLDADATIECAHRWGARDFYLNGHTLTRVGGDNLMFYYSQVKTAGRIVNTAGTLTLQNQKTFAVAEDPMDSAIVMDGGSFVLWGTTTPLNVPLVFNGGSFGAGSTKAATNQNIVAGDVHVAKNNTSVGLRQLNVKGRWITDGAYTTVFTGNGTTYFRKGSSATNLRFAAYDNAALWIEDGASLDCGMIRVGNSSSKRAAVYQRGGAVTNGNDGAFLSENASGNYGCWTLEDGILASRRTGSESWYIGRGEENGRRGVGMLVQKGGLFEARDAGTNAIVGVAQYGLGYLVQSGGLHDYSCPLKQQVNRLFVGYNGGRGVVAVRGSNTVLRTSNIKLGGATPRAGLSPQTLLAVTDGARIEADRLFAERPADAEAAARSSSYIYFDGGTILDTFTSGFVGIGITAANFLSRNPDHFVLGPNGLVLDTSCCWVDVKRTKLADTAQVPFAFEAPSGKGLASITLPDLPSVVTSSATTNYLGSMPLIIEGPGHGAAAYADFDYRTRTLKPVILSPGCGYDETTKVYLPYANYPDGFNGNRFACACTLADNETTGGLTKRGSVPLCLLATNSYRGATCILEGDVRAYSDGVIPQGNDLTVKKGARLWNYTMSVLPLEVGTLAGAGTVTNYNVTVTKSIALTVAELFADREPLKVCGSLAFAEGATVTIADPENLEACKNAPKAAFATAATLTGMPALVVPEGVVGAWQVTRSGNTLSFGYNHATAILIR